MIILRLQRRADGRVVLEQLHRQSDKVAEVDAMRIALELFIGRVDTGHLPARSAASRASQSSAFASMASASAA